MNQPDLSDANVPEWGRDTPWRQGMFLSHEAATAFGIAHDGDQDTAIVVISHDCDLAQPPESEPEVEILIGKFIEKLDGNYSSGKNTRTLHLECTAGPAPRFVALTGSNKRSLPKLRPGMPSLAAFVPRDEIRMSPRERRTLQLWLASRYHRSAFPDEFDRRLNEETGVKERIAKAFKDSGAYISAMFFDIDEGHEVPRNGAADTYSLYITLMYSTASDPGEAFDVAQKTADRIEEIFSSRCKVTVDGVESWKWIELCGIDAIADDAITVAQSQALSKWHGDHISLRTDPEQPVFVDR